MSIPLEQEFSVTWMGQRAEGGLQLLSSTFNLQLQVWQGSQAPKVRWDECDPICGVSINSAVTSPHGELRIDQQLSQQLSQQEPKVSNRWGKHVSAAKPRIFLGSTLIPRLVWRLVWWMIKWMVGCPWCLPGFDSPTLDWSHELLFEFSLWCWLDA